MGKKSKGATKDSAMEAALQAAVKDHMRSELAAGVSGAALERSVARYLMENIAMLSKSVAGAAGRDFGH